MGTWRFLALFVKIKWAIACEYLEQPLAHGKWEINGSGIIIIFNNILICYLNNNCYF